MNQLQRKTEVALGIPVEQVQIALFVFAGICVGLAVWLVASGRGKLKS